MFSTFYHLSSGQCHALKRFFQARWHPHLLHRLSFFRKYSHFLQIDSLFWISSLVAGLNPLVSNWPAALIAFFTIASRPGKSGSPRFSTSILCRFLKRILPLVRRSAIISICCMHFILVHALCR